tara:strand:+ start:1020 stop:1181 length:162 start_codon:yes stop_codon:yes gene_type:complete
MNPTCGVRAAEICRESLIPEWPQLDTGAIKQSRLVLTNMYELIKAHLSAFFIE